MCACAGVFLRKHGEQRAVAAVSNRFLQFVSGEQKHTHTESLPLLHLTTRRMAEQNKDKRKRDMWRESAGEEITTETNLWRGRLDSAGFQLKRSTGGWQLMGNPLLQFFNGIAMRDRWIE